MTEPAAVSTLPRKDIHAHRLLILDFGSQYTQLIARRVRERGVYSEIHPWDMSDEAIGAIIAGFFGRRIGDTAAMWTTCSLLGLSAVLSWIVLFDVAVAGNVRTTELFTWINSGDLEVSWALRVDQLTAVMFMVVATVSTVIHIYSVGYMAHDPHRPRFFAYLSLFTFFMFAS